MAISRRSTFNPAGMNATPLQPRKTMTWSVFAQQPAQPAEPRLHLALFPKYWLSREKLETWLGKKFPEYVGMFDIEVVMQHSFALPL